MKPIPFPKVQADFRAMAGGLDLVTPRISLDPGKCFDAQNYEPVTVGGYRRINGYERFDGRPSPTSAQYSVITGTITGTVSVGATLTGGTSAATGKVLGVFDSTIVLGRVTGTFQIAEALKISGVTVATSTSGAYQAGASKPSDDADYRLLAANDLRGDIGQVPGSGAIRGVFILNDVRYAFRDNVGATQSLLYKATNTGWTLVPFGREIQFTGATAQINDGDTVTGATSGASAVAKRVLLRTGSWGSAGAGTIVFASVTGTFQNGENLQVAGLTKAVAAGADTAITRAAGGSVETVRENFFGAAGTLRTYGCDGVNFAFEFDGTTYVPIRTGMPTDAPTHVWSFRDYLFLSFGASVQFSGIGAPYAWSVVLGAGEISTGANVTGFVTQAGNFNSASLAIFTASRTSILYGTSASNFVLIPSIYELGYSAGTIQPVANNTYGLTARGIQSLVTTLNYGDFELAAISFFVQPLVNAKQGLETASVALKAKNQYRLFFSDGTALAVGLTGEKVAGIMPLNYGKVVRCITNATLSDGTEVTYFGSDDGYVYQDNVGTSFDGGVIDAWVRPAFNNLRSPLVRKQYRRARFEVDCEGFSQVNIAYDLGYASADAQPPATQANQQIFGAGAYWDQFTWDQFTWDAALVSMTDVSLDGAENNIGFLFYSSRAQDDPHTLQAVNLLYTPRRLVHSGS